MVDKNNSDPVQSWLKYCTTLFEIHNNTNSVVYHFDTILHYYALCYLMCISKVKVIY